jgi:transposase
MKKAKTRFASSFDLNRLSRDERKMLSMEAGKLYAEGESELEVSRTFGCNYVTAYRWRKDFVSKKQKESFEKMDMDGVLAIDD